MTAYIAMIEAKINKYLKPKDKEDWKEKTVSQAENISGVPRERMVSMGVLMLSIYVLLGNFLPLFSHLICIYWPVKESFQILRKQKKPSDNILLYWILYGIVSLFDFSVLPGFPFYYFAKIGLFLSITTNGIDKLKEWAEPALKFTETWVLVPAPSAVEDIDD